MDGYYSQQSNLPYFSGVTRQRGRGIGALALPAARTALTVFRKFVLPAAKRVGKDFLEEAAPELLDVVAGKAKPKQAFKRAAKKTARRQLGKGVIRKQTISRNGRKKRRKVDILAKLK